VIDVVEVDFDHADSARLRRAQRVELELRYGADTEPGVAPTASDITAFFVAYADGTPAGCGGLRELDCSHAEIKRMFVDPAFRGTGVSTAILRQLEQFGSARGWTRLVLETGKEQPDAVGFYEREGFTAIPLFGSYLGSETSLCYGKFLASA
jgi:GNAT superfamily N-acetyltransferase